MLWHRLARPSPPNRRSVLDDPTNLSVLEKILASILRMKSILSAEPLMAPSSFKVTHCSAWPRNHSRSGHVRTFARALFTSSPPSPPLHQAYSIQPSASFGHLEGFVGEVGPHVQPVTRLSETRLVSEKCRPLPLSGSRLGWRKEQLSGTGHPEAATLRRDALQNGLAPGAVPGVIVEWCWWHARHFTWPRRP